MPCDLYSSYAELSKNEVENKDYRRVIIQKTDSCVAIIAPHGGAIERGTSKIAKEIAKNNFNLYIFEGTKPKQNRNLHITSHNFDDPECLDLIINCEIVISIHGCIADGECVLLGGLDNKLIKDMSDTLKQNDLNVLSDGHKFSASDTNNICNRGKTGRGVQVEISATLRLSQNASKLAQIIQSILNKN